MAISAVFLDTAGLLALVNQGDALHTEAVRCERQFALDKTPMLTTDWVLAEFLGITASVRGRGPAIRLIERLRSSRRVAIEAASRASWSEGYERYCERADKEWSLVDCISMVACETHRITDVFTHDHHFVQAGLSVLL